MLKNKISNKIFTAKTLSPYDGQNGQPAYVAVDGVVYDVSNAFVDGAHFSHLAGKDLSEDFHSFHLKDTIDKYPVVGIYKP